MSSEFFPFSDDASKASSNTPASISIKSASYRDWISRDARQVYEMNDLREFLAYPGPQVGNIDTRVTLLGIGSNKDQQCIPYWSDIRGSAMVEQVLSLPEPHKPRCQLFLVENIDPETICLLGGTFSIDPRAFAEHLDTTAWHRINQISDRLPALPSISNGTDFISTRFISPRTLEQAQQGSHQSWDIYSSRQWGGRRQPAQVTQQKFSAGGHVFSPVVYTQQTVTIYFNRQQDEEGWTGVILFDPPFTPEARDGRMHSTERRPFSNNASFPTDTHSSESTREIFTSYLRGDEDLLSLSREHPWVLLRDLYRIIASEWVLVNTYLERELAATEEALETDQPGVHEMEQQLKFLSGQRRRIEHFLGLARDHLQCISSLGRRAWTLEEPSADVLAVRNELWNDFNFVAEALERSRDRVKRNVGLLSALIASHDSKLRLANAQNSKVLTLATAVLLCFVLVAVVLGMQGGFAAGSAQFWVFWVVSLILVTLLVGCSLLLSRLGWLTFAPGVCRQHQQHEQEKLGLNV